MTQVYWLQLQNAYETIEDLWPSQIQTENFLAFFETMFGCQVSVKQNQSTCIVSTLYQPYV